MEAAANNDLNGIELAEGDHDVVQQLPADWAQLDAVPAGNEFHASDNSYTVKLAIGASWVVNWFLLGIKLFAAIQSSSKAVTAALADSAVDLASQGVLTLADRYMGRHSPDYPVGRSRLEALSVIACAFIVSIASIEVIQFSAEELYEGLESGKLPPLQVGTNVYIVLGIVILSKFVLWILCLKVSKLNSSDIVAAFAEDHFNDVMSNTAAAVTAAVAFNTPYWWIDPVGAILISLVLISRWILVIKGQVKKIVGFTAPKDFIAKVEKLAMTHDPRLEVDCTRVYHFGARFNVEMEVILPGTMTVMESHDIALELQQKIENLEEVERAFVHVDHRRRDILEHKVERELESGRSLVNPG